MSLRRLLSVLATVAALALPPAVARAETAIDVTIKDHRFTPAEIHVPAGKAAVLNIKNEDATAEEFDSSALKVEKVIAGGKQGTVRLRPLDPGRYPFMGEYHEDTAQGVVIAE
ncbi:MAG: cupredoxin domain-containing protein [Methyloceanibacter sp.]|nr:cupredoxin domain-containing protein [Methyloceanibacter sp.]